jgi:hypothetical protein
VHGVGGAVDDTVQRGGIGVFDTLLEKASLFSAEYQN